jgi:hypothetical protein
MFPPEPLEYADVVSQRVRDDGRYRGAVLDQADNASRVESTSDAAEAKASS